MQTATTEREPEKAVKACESALVRERVLPVEPPPLPTVRGTAISGLPVASFLFEVRLVYTVPSAHPFSLQQRPSHLPFCGTAGRMLTGLSPRLHTAVSAALSLPLVAGSSYRCIFASCSLAQ